MTSRGQRRRFWLRSLPAAIVAVVTLVFTLGLVTAPRAVAQEPTQITLDPVTLQNGLVVITGTLKNADGVAVLGGVQLEIDGQVDQSTTQTAEDGFTYSFTFAVPLNEGWHTIRVFFTGDIGWQGSEASTTFYVPGTGGDGVVVDPTMKIDTGISLKANPTTVNVGQSFEVTGALQSPFSGVDSAMIDFVTSWGNISAMAVTDSAGGFSAVFQLPNQFQGEVLPSGVTVTATYLGDSVYNGSTQQVTIALLGPLPSASPTPTAAPTTPEATPMATPSAEASPTIDTVAVQAEALWGHFAVILALVLVIAVIAAIAFVVVVVVAQRRKALANDEQRGFGSDFGKKEPPAGDRPASPVPSRALPDEPAYAGAGPYPPGDAGFVTGG